MPPVPLFWFVALLLVAATVAALVWPLLRARAGRSTDPADAGATDVYRDQKRQLDDELAAGAITRAERDAQLDELAARLGAELDAAAGAPPVSRATPRSSYVAALILVAAIPASAMLLYAVFGSPGSLRIATQSNERAPMSEAQIVAMVEKLATRMKERPEDPTGWRLLARAYAAMGRYKDSVDAFTQAAARSPEDASLLADWADALAMQNQSLQGEPSRLVARALTLDPNHPKALSLAGSAALERKDYATAAAEWRKLKAQFPAGSEEAKQIDAMIAEANAAQRGTSTTGAASRGAADATSPGATPATATGAAPASTAPGGIQPDAAAAAITGRVSIDPKLAARVAANDTLFVFARAANGLRMPLAVLRTTAGALPHDFRLDDSMAMTPAARLSKAKDVIVEARISKSGNATPSSGDLHGASPPVKPGAQDVSIVIDDIVR